MTRAPILAAMSGVQSVELLSTTMTSVARDEGRSARTRSIACASLWVGMITDTRPGLARSPPRRRRRSLREPGINSPCPASTSDSDSERCKHRNEKFPDPRRAPLRHPKARKIQEGHEGDRACEQTDN